MFVSVSLLLLSLPHSLTTNALVISFPSLLNHLPTSVLQGQQKLLVLNRVVGEPGLSEGTCGK